MAIRKTEPYRIGTWCLQGTNKKRASLDSMKNNAPGENSEGCWCNIP
jgi:hypothetical protein